MKIKPHPELKPNPIEIKNLKDFYLTLLNLVRFDQIFSFSNIKGAVGASLNEQQISNYLNKLLEEGKIFSEGKNIYKLTPPSAERSTGQIGGKPHSIYPETQE